MPQTNSVYKRIDTRLAQTDTDPLFSPVYLEAFPPLEVPFSIGKARKKNVRAFYEQVEGFSDKFSIARTVNTTDSFTDYSVNWQSDGFEFSEADLGEFAIRGFTSEGQMIAEEREITSTRFRKSKELNLYAYEQDNNNFAGATYYANAGVAWSNWGISSPGDDVWTGLQLVKRANAIIMGIEDYYNCLANATINASAQAAGMDKGALNPTIGVEYLKRYFRVQFLWIAGGSVTTDSADRTDETETDIWQDSVLLFYHDPRPSVSRSSWMKQIFNRPKNVGELPEGWRIIETFNPEPGGIGVRKWAFWNNYDYLQQDTKLAYRIDNTH